MGNTEVISGVHTYLLYGAESAYGTATTVTSHLGIVTGYRPSVDNQLSLRRGFTGTATTSREAVSTVAGAVNISQGVDFDVINWSFMEYVLGSASGTSTVTYTPADDLKSVTIAHNLDNPGTSVTDREETYAGTVFDSCTIRCSVGEPVTASVDFMSKTLAYEGSLTSKVALPSQDVYTFAGGDIEIPDSTSISNVIDSMEILIRNNVNLLYGLGSRLAQRAYGRALEYEIRFTVKYISDDLLNKALGGTSPASGGPTATTLTAKFVSGSRSCELRFSGVQINWSADATMNELLSEDITATARNLVAVEIV